jgi:hypothetical protein
VIGVEDLVRSGVGGTEGSKAVHVREQIVQVGNEHLVFYTLKSESGVEYGGLNGVPSTYNKGIEQSSAARSTDRP